MTVLDEPPPPPALPPAAPSPPRQAPPISRRLAEPLRRVAGRDRMLSLLRAGCQLATAILILWLILVLILGSWREIPVPVAFILVGTAWLLLLTGFIYCYLAARGGRDLSATARLVDAAIPDTHERISSALELTQETDPRFRGSPELIAVLVRQAEHAAEKLDPHIVISGKSVFYWFLATLPLFLVWFVLLIVMTPTLTLGIERLVQPWRAAAPLPSAYLEVDPQNATIAQGDTVSIKVAVTLPSTVADRRIEHATITRRFSAGNTNEDVTNEMDVTDDHSFHIDFPNVQQTFSYRIAAAGAQSPTYTITVNPRPTISDIHIDYTYPAYTGLPPHSENSREGSIDALVGTRVHLTLTAAQPLKLARLTLTDNAPDPDTFNLVPLDASNTKFGFDFTVRRTTDYRLHLTNQQDLDNADTQARSIVARLDAPPQINITSPTDPALKVRSEDTVPVKFTAADDFAVTRIEAIAQIDNRPPTVTLLPLTGADHKSITDTWNLSLHDLLKNIAVAPPALPAPKRIAYQLRVTDNRDPDPQIALSAKQYLDIDTGVAPLAERQDKAAARTLAEAVKQADERLASAQSALDTLRKAAGTRTLTDAEKQQIAGARHDISEAAQTLQTAADKTSDSRLADAARQARQIADGPIKQSEADAAASALAADQPDSRNKSLDAADQHLADARSQLQQLSQSIEEKAKDQPLAHELERIAAEQRKLADALAQNPNDPSLKARQHQLQKDLEQVIKEHPDLQKPAADAAKADTQQVQEQIRQLQQAQQPLNDAARAEAETKRVGEKLNDLARQQEQLNQKIKEFADKQNETLHQADASRPPSASQLDSIPRDLRDKNLPAANQTQNAAAAALDQTAQDLENAARRSQEDAATNARLAEQAAQQAREAAALQQKVNDLHQQIEDARRNHNPPTRPSDPANQQATQLAEQIKRQANQLPSSQRNLARQISEQADKARQSAARGEADSAQQQLSSAASQLADAASAAQNSNNPVPPTAASQAADEARQLADQQRQLAEQTGGVSRSLDTAEKARSNAQQTAQQQRQLADQMQQAAQSARNLQQKMQGAAPDLSQRAGRAAEELQKAADAQRAAANANQNNDASQAASQQTQSAQQLASASQSLDNSQSNANAQSSASSNRNDSSSGQSAGARSSSPQSSNSQSSSSGSQASNQSGSNQSSPADSNSQRSPGSAGSSSSGGSRFGMGTPGRANGSSPNGSSGSVSSQNGSPGGASAPNGSAPGGSAPGSAAAQAVQAARDAQSQATDGNPAAARQAAEQLAQASRQLLSGSNSSGSSGQSSGERGNAAGISGAPAGSGQPSARPTGGTGAGMVAGGSIGSSTPGAGPRGTGGGIPKPVEDIGVSPSDWAKLPSNMQQQLLNSAQQSGPPAYRDMIKNYYSRIANLEQQQQGSNP